MSLVCDGTSNYLINGTFPLSGPPFSYGVWAKPSQVSAFSPMFTFSAGSGTTDFWQLFQATTTALASHRARDTSDALATAAALTQDVWQLIGANEVLSTSRFTYLDGTAGTENTTDRTPDAVDGTRLGASAGTAATTATFVGKLGYPFAYNFALSDAQWLQLAGGLPPNALSLTGEEALVVYQPCVAAKNESGSVLTMSDQGTPVFDAADNPPIILVPVKIGLYRRGRAA